MKYGRNNWVLLGHIKGLSVFERKIPGKIDGPVKEYGI